MRGVYQHHTCRLGILWVQPEHVYGEGDFVGDALARWLSLGPKFQVFQSVIVALAVFVMNAFAFYKRTAKVLFHSVAMLLHDSSLPAGVEVCRDGNKHVPLLTVISSFLGTVKSLRGSKAAKFRATFRAAQFLLLVYRSTWAPLYRHWIAALNAVNLPLLVGELTTLSAAFGRAVFRVFAPLFPVTGKYPRRANELLTAHATIEPDQINAANAYSVRVVAGLGTKFATLTWAPGKLFSAIQAVFHGCFSVVANENYHVHCLFATSQERY